tara:strand:+ start:2820 stop:3383 length:564 start_codon:yes stop_codon:yes gene_type:complete
MRSPFYFITKPVSGRRYDNIKKIGDIDFITSVSQEDHTSTNRFAEVVSVPLGYIGEIKPGHILLVHHNVFKIYYDMRGREKSGRSFFKEDLYFIDFDQFFLYYNDVKWQTHSKYCFVKPQGLKESYILKPGSEEPLTGTVVYGNEELKSLGVQQGDEVIFEPESEYPFYINGEKLYRMFTNNITIVL